MTRWSQRLLWIAGTAVVMYGMVYVDVVLRARHAYQEGEQYWRWSDHPGERADYLNRRFSDDKAALDRRLAQGKISKDDYDRSLELLQFDRDQALKESTIKYAYVWYQTAVDLFSPPESKWVRMARQKMPLAKERWESELRAHHIPFQDYMVQ